MKPAQEILRIKEEKRQQKIKENAELVNKELLEIEKVLNKYESDLEDTKEYITVPLIITTNEVKELLKQNGYCIDKVSNDIEVNTTRIWLDEKVFNTTVDSIGFKRKQLENEFNKVKEDYDNKLKNESMLDDYENIDDFYKVLADRITKDFDSEEISPRMYSNRRRYY